MYLLLFFQFVQITLCSQPYSSGTYFKFSNATVYKEEVILVIPNTSLVPCLLQCKSIGACVDVTLSAKQDCLLLRGNKNSSGGEVVMATRLSPLAETKAVLSTAATALTADGMCVIKAVLSR